MKTLIGINKADLWLFATICLYFIMNGAQLWETALMIPAWTAAPPASLIFFQEPYGLDFKIFWILLHSLLGLVFIAALVFNWKTSRRYPLLVLLFLHLAVRAWTIIFFAPEIIEFQNIPYLDTIDKDLVDKATIWRNLNYLRVGLFTLVNFSLIALILRRKGIDK